MERKEVFPDKNWGSPFAELLQLVEQPNTTIVVLQPTKNGVFKLVDRTKNIVNTQSRLAHRIRATRLAM
jgi:hypothetical protein